jgi:hypothetical protein
MRFLPGLHDLRLADCENVGAKISLKTGEGVDSTQEVPPQTVSRLAHSGVWLFQFLH